MVCRILLSFQEVGYWGSKVKCERGKGRDYVEYLHGDMHVSTECFFIIIFRNPAAERRACTRIFHRTLFLASLLSSAQVFLTPLASSSTVVRHVCLGGSTLRACLAMLSDGFRSVWPSHPHLRFLIWKPILGCFVCFHNSLFIIWPSQKIFSIFLTHLLIKTAI
jgi:hypothetical protein